MLSCVGPGEAPAVSSRMHGVVIIRPPQRSPERQFQQATFTSRLWTWTMMLNKKIFQILVTERSLNLNSGPVCRGNGSSYTFAILQITQGPTHWNGVRQSHNSLPAEGEILPKHHPPPAFFCLNVPGCVCPPFNIRACLNWLSSLAQEKTKSAEM